jgi:2-polyprenyl-6-methoxyphenol hydroxylase-like FAD-dependent oxidoreductase
LTAARVLADHFERVTLVEADRFAGSREPRKGVPQANHLHGLLLRGQQLMEQLFPGLLDGLVAEGAVRVEFGRDLVWHHFGGWKAAVPKDRVSAVCMSRLLLEAEIRKRVLGLPRVRLLDDCRAMGLAADPERRRVTGLVVRRAGAEAEETLEADLVVDASGRGSRAPAWLEQLGRPRVQETLVHNDAKYATRLFQRPPDGTFPWKGMFVGGAPPGPARHGVLWPIEGGRWIVSLVGLLGDHPPADEQGWLEFAKGLSIPDMHAALQKATPVSDVMVFKFLCHQRRHYERMADMPEGFVVLGDAHCSFSPNYGQGMTTATIGSVLLGEMLAQQRRNGSPRFSRAFQKALARSADDPWAAATGEDFRFPGTKGDRPLGFGLINWYTWKLHRAATVDPEVAKRFYKMMHMVVPSSELMSPGMIWRVLRSAPPEAQARS